MDGIICVYKEKDWTSFDVVAVIRKLFKTKKVGHGGTLDPLAEGVLPVFIGAATKAADFCPDNTKQYLAGFRFGITTDTEDITGHILSEDNRYVSRNKMILIERKFRGELMQTPPMYSAVKVDGQRLYDLARQGIEVERKPRPIRIYNLKIQNYRDNEGEMLVTCSKGTYIRTLIADIGKEMEVGAVMTSLIRTRSGMFTLNDCHTIGELEQMAQEGGDEALGKILMPLEKLYENLPKAHLDAEQTRLFNNGAVLDADRIKFDIIQDKGYYIEGSSGVFLGLGVIDEQHNLKVIRRFNTENSDLGEKNKLPEEEFSPEKAENEQTPDEAHE